jgi:hypothetical protein
LSNQGCRGVEHRICARRGFCATVPAFVAILKHTKRHRSSIRKAATAVLATLALLAAGCQKAEIKVYTVPKEQAPSLPAFAAPAPEIHWELPAGWEESKGHPMRAASFRVPGENGLDADVSIMALPPQAGDELENVNRWRGELGLGPIAADQLAAQVVTVCDAEGRLFDLVSDRPRLAGDRKERTLAAMADHGGQMWFFKMRGEADLVAREKTKFIAFLESIDFHGEPAQTAAPRREPAAPAFRSPQWTVPDGWQPETPGPMVQVAFDVGGSRGAPTKVSVSVFPGDAGGVLANVNRWRAQVGLGPVAAADLPRETAKLDLAGSEAIVADMTGKDMRTGGPARLIAVTVPQGAQTWFYKLLGEPDVVAAEKENFLGFIRSARH